MSWETGDPTCRTPVPPASGPSLTPGVGNTILVFFFFFISRDVGEGRHTQSFAQEGEKVAAQALYFVAPDPSRERRPTGRRQHENMDS